MPSTSWRSEPTAASNGNLRGMFFSFSCVSWLVIFLCATDRLNLGQQVAELAVVDLHAVIQVQLDPHVGVVLQLLVEGEEFGLLLPQVVLLLLELLAVRGRGRLRLV